MKTLIYGAYGYTGELITREAIERDLDIVVAGRNGTKTRGLGIELEVEARVFDPGEMAAQLDDIDVVLNCAGPFTRTYEPIVEACLDNGAAYLDINGELPIFEALAERDREAEEAGIPILPGVGFEIVPTDCLALHLHDRLPDATHLRIGVRGRPGLSGGTVATLLEHADSGASIRRDGVIEQLPIGSHSREIDFGDGPRNATLVPLADVSTAYYTTGIGNIEAYAAMPELAERALRLGHPLTSIFSVTPIKRTLQRAVRTVVGGPSERAREQNRVSIWGEATNGDRTVVSRLETPEPYSLTVDSTTSALQHLESMETLPTGFETPSVAFDAEFVLELDGVEGFFDDGERVEPVPTPE